MLNEQMYQLIQEKMKQLNRYLIRLGANQNDAEDIVQETLYKGILYVDSIDPEKFSAWPYKVALNRYYDLCRQKKRIEVPIESVIIEDSEIPEDLLMQKEIREEIEHVLNQLSPIHKQLLILKYELDLSYKEIASLLDIKEGLVKTYLFRARRQFQKIYRRDKKYE